MLDNMDEHKFHAANFHQEVGEERQHQIDKWGLEWRSPEVLIAVLMEEVGEVARAALENNHDDYLKEVVQVAAVACQMYEACIMRAGKEEHMIAELEGLKPR